jgi:hypothetical protein
MYPLPFVVLLMDCPVSFDLAAYFNSAAGALLGVNFPLGTPWALGKVDRAGKWRRCVGSIGQKRLHLRQPSRVADALPTTTSVRRDLVW